MAARDDYWEQRFPKRRPVRGGIEARSARGSFATTWWGRSLVDVVERDADPGRLTRGRSYARSGQVVSMRLADGDVIAEVQGSQPYPFACRFGVRKLADDEREQLVTLVRAAPGMLADIVSGSLPTRLGGLLLPPDSAELTFECTCPDFGFPCKHVAAVVYLTAERLDEHPLDMLTLRGVDLGALIDGIEHDVDRTDDRDLYGDEITLPALPDVEPRCALDDMDPTPLRGAMRLLADERAVETGMRDLRTLYAHLLAESAGTRR